MKTWLRMLFFLAFFLAFNGCSTAPEKNWVKKINNLHPKGKQEWLLKYDSKGRLVKFGDASLVYQGDKVTVTNAHWVQKGERLHQMEFYPEGPGKFASVSNCELYTDSTSEQVIKKTDYWYEKDTLWVNSVYMDEKEEQPLRSVKAKYVYASQNQPTEILHTFIDAEGNAVSTCHSYYKYNDNITHQGSLNFNAFVIDNEGMDVFLFHLFDWGKRGFGPLANDLYHSASTTTETYWAEGMYRIPGELMNKMEIITNDFKVKTRLEIEHYGIEEEEKYFM